MVEAGWLRPEEQVKNRMAPLVGTLRSAAAEGSHNSQRCQGGV